MNIRQHFYQALTNLTSAKMRSILAVLGILVGTASVVALVSIGESATQKALEQFKTLGTDLLSVSLIDERSSSQTTPTNTLSFDELRTITNTNPAINRSAPYTTAYASISYQGRKIEGVIIGATEMLKTTLKIKMDRGGFISYLNQYQNYCVIGHKVYQEIKKTSYRDPIGKQIRLGDHVFTIIGITKTWPENAFFNADIDRSIIIPIKATQLISKNSKINNIIFSLKADADIDEVQNTLKKQLHHTAPDLKIFFRSAKEIIKSMKQGSAILTILLGTIGGISLFVGGIGVMNVMLVSVTERRREIGIRKAIGARHRDIHYLFLFESIALTLFGGLLGICFGVAVSLVVAYFAKWGLHIFLLPLIIGFSVSAATGLFFGLYPAIRAARLNPIQALRYE